MRLQKVPSNWVAAAAVAVAAASCPDALAQEQPADEAPAPVFSDQGPWPGADDGPRDEDEAGPVEDGAAATQESQPLQSIPVAKEEPAAAPTGPTTLDEITVTAQKREQRVQDVPVSISVMSDKFIAEYGITDVRELLLFVPNMKVEAGSTLGGPKCRGFGLNIRNRAFEPPCGVAIDGVPYTSADYFYTSLFDVQRVEVMRGPQGTTFGKNTTAGVIHVITKNPSASDEGMTGGFGLQVGDFERKRGEAAFGSSFFDGSMNVRIAGFKEERQGYLRNTTAKIVPGAVEFPLTGDRSGVRAKLGFPDLFGSRLLLSYENSSLLVHGFGAEAFDVSDRMQQYMRDYDPGADFVQDNFITSVDYPDTLDTRIQTWQMDLAFFASGWTFNAVGAQSVADHHGGADSDYFPVPAIFGIQGDISPTTSLEIRGIPTTFTGLYGLKELFGIDLGSSELLAGVYYQKRAIKDGLLYLEIDDQHLANILAIDSGTEPSPITVPGTPATESVTSGFGQDSETLAGFAELQWHFADRWMLQWGMRYSVEEKSATWNQVLSDPHPILTAAGWSPFVAAKEHSERQFLPKVALNYKPWDNVSLFARWTRGFKGGGFNAFSLSGENSTLTSLTFGPERGEEWAFDAKMELFDNMAVNLSLFKLDVFDFQFLVQVNDPNTDFPAGNTVVNVGHARAQGAEGDITWIPTNWLRLLATIGLNDNVFVDFPYNNCPQGQSDTDGDGDPRCSATGKPFPQTPKWDNTLSANLHMPIADIIGFYLAGTEIGLGFTVQQTGWQYLNADLNERSLQDGFFSYRASVSLSNKEQGWSFSVVGENLTDVVSSQRQDRILGVTGNYLEPRRSTFSQFQMSF